MVDIIRTPTKATGGVTPAELAAMTEHSKLWTSRALRTTPVDRAEITSAIEDLYAASGCAKKPRVVVVSSPAVMAFVYGAAAAIWHSRGGDGTKDLATSEATYRATRAATRKNI